MDYRDIPISIYKKFRRGTVIPAMPLALTERREFDRVRQRALLRYYIDSGVGGIAAGVHSTQFEIRRPEHGLYGPVLVLAGAEIDAWSTKRGKEVMKIAGVIGPTDQASREAEHAESAGYHACLLGLGALSDANDEQLIKHCRTIAAVIPVVGFYLQQSIGGRRLSYDFWREFAGIDNVIGIKIAPFDRYKTFDVVRAVAEAGREEQVVLPPDGL